MYVATCTSSHPLIALSLSESTAEGRSVSTPPTSRAPPCFHPPRSPRQDTSRDGDAYTMVPVSESATRPRWMDLPHRNGSSSSLFQPKGSRAALVTYGKKDTRLLPLTANHFRSDIYAIPSDDEDDDDDEFSAQQNRTRSLLRATERRGNFDDSALSDTEPLPSASLLNEKKGITTPQTRQHNVTVGRNHSSASSLVDLARDKNGPARPVRPPRPRAVYRHEERRKSTITSDIRTKISKKSNPRYEHRKEEPQRKATTSKRRLPVNELLLVSSPLDTNGEVHSDDMSRGDQTQDPIEDSTISTRKRRSPSSTDNNGDIRKRPVKAPLSVFRAQLKPLKYLQKSLRSVRRSVAEYTALMNANVESRGRDGFEDSELAIQPHHVKVKRKCTRKAHLVLKVGCLLLNNGPLPDVDFESSTTELKMEQHSLNAAARGAEQLDYGNVPAPRSTVPGRAVSFGNPTRDDLIRAQLSSVSAPERMPSESEDSDVEEDREVYDDNNVANKRSTDSALLGEDSQSVKSSSIEIIEHPVSRHSDEDIRHGRIYQPKKVNTGVTLDFRHPLIPRQLPKQPLRKRHLIETNEGIVEVPDSDLPLAENLSGSNRTSGTSHIVHEQSDLLPQHRQRSILRNSIPAVSDSTTRAENTRANTRRNTLVDASESRYFADASDMLDASDLPQHRIIPRRSSYFTRANVEVPDTEGVAPETSPEPIHSFNLGRPHGLRRIAEVTSPSSRLPTASQYLNTLSRVESREHGALSLSARRGPSMLLQPPTNPI